MATLDRTTAATGLDVEIAPGKPALLRVTETVRPEHAADWIADRRTELDDLVLRHGAVLVRGLGIRDAATLRRAGERLTTLLAPEREAFARRQQLGADVVSSLEWPADQPMCMHHELSHALEFPRLLVIGCFTAPEKGGVTGVADAQRVLAELPAPLVERFVREGWTLTRSYNNLVGLSWKEAFNAADRTTAEEYCRANGITAEWQADGRLRTHQRRSAVIHHPITGARCWFNQVGFLSEWNLDPAVRAFMLGQFGPDGLPFTTSYGDGEPLDAETVGIIADVYESATLREPWQVGDLFLVDNIRMAHSREPFVGERTLGLIFGDPVRLADCTPGYPPPTTNP
ncbi:SyrP [Streptomyces chattanoogensis]|uniref:SyrP n=1 Tax=Streptomyces chattanoogensis TaxID=66876 RepID=A0A0N1JYI3_9ACTN|nr:TauD/TfdA family dioxygenase [Streptomyces chattanoogensis]KPC64235.1 SyrP [Streptomyces chattanoogensis]